MHAPSPFIDAAAVEAWDAWFRWREHDRLHDRAIESTWRRAAAAVAGRADGGLADALIDAYASWRLLLDERILATAGTPSADWPRTELAAVLNAAAFVRWRLSPTAQFDRDRFVETAALAVRALDAAGAGATPLRIGVVGLADAIALLGLRYRAPLAREQAREIVRALAEGCLRGSVQLARERGARFDADEDTLRSVSRRGLATELIRDVRRCGLRHRRLTAIAPQPRLALLANNVADALDPLLGENRLYRVATRAVRSSGYALTLARSRAPARTPAAEPIDTLADLPIGTQLAMRGAVQPWIDEPIRYPLPLAREPDDDEWQLAGVLAQAHGLARPEWRLVDDAAPATGADALRSRR